MKIERRLDRWYCTYATLLVGPFGIPVVYTDGSFELATNKVVTWVFENILAPFWDGRILVHNAACSDHMVDSSP